MKESIIKIYLFFYFFNSQKLPMKKCLLILFVTLITHLVPLAQTIETYRSSREKINNLVHTKLEVDLNYPKRQLNGKAWITLTPHFYPTDSLRLDAKGMDIHQV